MSNWTSGNWIDITVPVREGMPGWPGDPSFTIKRILDQANGDVCTLSHISLSVHTGTHMDAPLHFLPDGATMDAMPLDAVIGPVRVIPIRHTNAIHRAELLEHGIQPGERILFRTINSDGLWRSNAFYQDFVFIARDGAEYLAEVGIQTVGVDYLSVGGFTHDGLETHQALLRAGIWIVEGLDLGLIEPGNYEMVCLPLRLVNAEGSPARAILRKA